jgi:hypothetical protein
MAYLVVPAMYLTWAFGANLAVLAYCEINNLRVLNIRRGYKSHPLRQPLLDFSLFRSF